MQPCAGRKQRLLNPEHWSRLSCDLAAIFTGWQRGFCQAMGGSGCPTEVQGAKRKGCSQSQEFSLVDWLPASCQPVLEYSQWREAQPEKALMISKLYLVVMSWNLHSCASIIWLCPLGQSTGSLSKVERCLSDSCVLARIPMLELHDSHKKN